jgi:mRNA-degrading endonuclease toxin of MazEF toxin-antitoxin module
MPKRGYGDLQLPLVFEPEQVAALLSEGCGVCTGKARSYAVLFRDAATSAAGRFLVIPVCTNVTCNLIALSSLKPKEPLHP